MLNYVKLHTKINNVMIREFRQEYRWLSNFAPVNIQINGIYYPSVEHAYMSEKSLDKSWKEFCANKENSAGKVKRASREVLLRDGWDSIKVCVMKECLEQKFLQNPYKELLIQTGCQRIEEGNNWGDTFWGVCLKSGKGENTLGNLIMKIRSNIKKTML